MKKIIFMFIIIGLLFSLSVSGLAAYPEEEIEWAIWSSPGGGSDITARTIGIPLRKSLGVSLVITNMPGGSGSRSMTYVQNQPADGYTWQFITDTFIVSMERGIVDYELSDWIPIARLNFESNSIAVSVDNQYGIETIDDLLEIGKENELKWGVSNMGSIDHLAAFTVSEMADLKIKPIVYTSGGEILVAALGNVIDAFWANPSEIMGQVDAGEIKILAVASEERLSTLPDVPTLREKGMQNAIFGTWRGVAVKKGTDPEICDAIENYLLEAAESDIYRNFLEENGIPYDVLGSDEFLAFVEDQYSWFAETGRKAGVIQD